jgi:hypothetical protein
MEQEVSNNAGGVKPRDSYTNNCVFWGIVKKGGREEVRQG